MSEPWTSPLHPHTSERAGGWAREGVRSERKGKEEEEEESKIIKYDERVLELCASGFRTTLPSP
jgi:hypothetical protein